MSSWTVHNVMFYKTTARSLSTAPC